jgi:RNA polymerase sigma factor (sigma-70 family)
MVLGVCRRALGCTHDADDACQATFMVFSRKAASIRKTASLASWLHAVAMRVIANLKRERARRTRRERATPTRSVNNPAEDVSWAEVQTVLDDELNRLPERYRAVLILCYLEGKTRDEAADQLGLSAGALHGLLERGRKQLADRLTKRGVSLSAGLFSMALCEGVAQATLSPTQVLTTAHASSLFAMGKPVGESVSATVLHLSQQVLKGMLMTKLKLASAGVICAVLLATTVGFTFAQSATDNHYGVIAGKGVRISVPALGPNDSDESFIKRVSKDLRDKEPTPTEVHFFVNSKDPKRRETLVDLFIKEREAKKTADKERVYSEQVIDFYYKSFLQIEETQKKRDLTITEFQRLMAQAQVEANAKSNVAKSELELLKANVAVAEASVRQKQVQLELAREAKAMEIELLTAELQRAQALLAQEQDRLKAAERKRAK